MKQNKLAPYYKLIDNSSLEKAWDSFMSILLKQGIKRFEKAFFPFNQIGDYYEYGLAYTNKVNKKDLGKFYTPDDVAKVMAKLLCDTNNINCIVDPGCGCGNLIIEFLKQAQKNKNINFNNLLKNIYIYDIDKVALNICYSRIKALFGQKCVIKKIHGDFLNKNILLPKDCFVISNPPYSRVKKVKNNWQNLPCLSESSDLYVGFIEKIIDSCRKAVIVSPQSFIVGKNFSKIRNKLNEKCHGEIYSFDNVPGTLFNGRKKGIFNTNTANGVRAAISVLCKKSYKHRGFRLSHLIRFKESERKNVLKISYLQKQLGTKNQDLTQPLKCFRELEDFVFSIIENNVNVKISSFITNKITDFPICINTSARYFVVGCKTQLKRKGYFTVYAKDKNSFYLLYSLLNSSYCYLFWRMMDGGILYSKSMFSKTPIPTIKISKKIKTCVDKMLEQEKKYLTYKKNAGEMQESIKFPQQYRYTLNVLLFGNKIDFSIIHSNKELI